MSKDNPGAPAQPAPKVVQSGPWRKFWQLVFEPWTALLLVVSVALFVIGQQKLDPSVTALIQILLAVASGVLGARVTNVLESASGKSILEARGKVAVRGLKLMLVQTSAFQRRVERFISNREHIETQPEVTIRNFEETVEFCRRIQEEAASAMETWVDVVPSADLSSLIGRITAAEDEREATKQELAIAQRLLDSNKVDIAHAEGLQEVINSLRQRVDESEKKVVRLNERLRTRTGEQASAAFENLKRHRNFLASVGRAEKVSGGLLGEFLKENPDLLDSDVKK
jgi:Lon protease-like protein